MSNITTTPHPARLQSYYYDYNHNMGPPITNRVDHDWRTIMDIIQRMEHRPRGDVQPQMVVALYRLLDQFHSVSVAPESSVLLCFANRFMDYILREYPDVERIIKQSNAYEDIYGELTDEKQDE